MHFKHFYFLQRGIFQSGWRMLSWLPLLWAELGKRFGGSASSIHIDLISLTLDLAPLVKALAYPLQRNEPSQISVGWEPQVPGSMSDFQNSPWSSLFQPTTSHSHVQTPGTAHHPGTLRIVWVSQVGSCFSSADLRFYFLTGLILVPLDHPLFSF